MNKAKAKKLLEAITKFDDNVKGTFASMDRAMDEAKEQLKQAVTAKTLGHVSMEFKRLNAAFKPIIAALEELKGGMEASQGETREQMAQRLGEMQSHLEEELSKASGVSLHRQLEVSREINDIKSQIAALDSKEIKFPEQVDYAPKIREVEARLTDMIRVMQENFEGDTETEELSMRLEKVRKELTDRINNIPHGGNQNRQISVKSSVMSTKYADLNFKNGGGVVWAAVDDNVNKRVDITASVISAGGGAGGTPGGSDTQVQYNDAGSFGGSAGVTWNKNSSILTTQGVSVLGSVNISNPSDTTALIINNPGNDGPGSLGNEILFKPQNSVFGYGVMSWYCDDYSRKDVIMQAHRAEFNDANDIHRHFSFYTSNADRSATVKRFNIPYKTDIANWTIENSSLEVQGNELTNPILHINNSYAASIGGANLVKLTNGPTNPSNQPILNISQYSSTTAINIVYQAPSSQNAAAIAISGRFGYAHTVNANGGYGLNISTNGTNTVSTSNGLARVAQLTTSDSVPVVNIENRSSSLSLYIHHSGTSVLSVTSRGNLNIGQPASIAGTIMIAGLTSGRANIQAASTAGNWTLTLPGSSGSAGQYLLTDGNGITQWASVTAVGGSGITRSSSIISVTASMAAVASTDYAYFPNVGISLSLPAANGNANLYTVKNQSNSSVLVTAGDGVDGGASALIFNQESLSFLSNNSVWGVV